MEGAEAKRPSRKKGLSPVMRESCIIAGRAEIPAAMSYLTGALPSAPPVCLLICEELLRHLTGSGYPEVTLKAGRKWIEIAASGERDSLDSLLSAEDPDRIDSEINLRILEQYADFIDFRYKNRVNRYRVSVSLSRKPDLASEISAYYRRKDSKPAGILLWLAKKHRGILAFSYLNIFVKHSAALLLPVFASNIIDEVSRLHAFFVKPVLWNAIAFFIALIVNLVCFRTDALVYHRFVRETETGFKMALVSKLQVLSLKTHSSTGSGRFLSKLISDVQFIGMLLYDRVTELLHLTIDVVFIIAIALGKCPPMLLFYLFIIPVTVLLLRRFSAPVLKLRTDVRRKTENTNAAFREMLAMNRLTRSHGLRQLEYRQISQKVRAVQTAAIDEDRMGVAVNNITFGVFQGFRLLCLCFAAFMAARGSISIGSVVLFQSIFDLIINNVQRVLAAMPMLVQGYDCLISISEILYAEDVEENGTVLLPEPVRGGIEFDHVSFRYEDDSRLILDDVSFSVPPGKSAALIGPSGAGKSTLLSLILGLYRKNAGEIRIDGVDVDLLEKEAYRRHIAVVPQETPLFAGTLWSNLVYGLPVVSTEQVLDALRRVGLQDLVSSHPDGLNRPINENGANLSGGQRQRIAIARALLRNAKIILLDEATSALDAENERQVQEAIDALMGSRTVIIVAHHLNTLRHADAIYRLRDGKITHCGTYEKAILGIDAEDDILG